MTVSEIGKVLSAELICGDADKPFSGVYVGDLLSRAMSRVEAGSLFVTIMANTNMIAVASLTEATAVILAEGVKLPSEAIEAADDNGITVLTSPLSAYEISIRIYETCGDFSK